MISVWELKGASCIRIRYHYRYSLAFWLHWEGLGSDDTGCNDAHTHTVLSLYSQCFNEAHLLASHSTTFSVVWWGTSQYRYNWVDSLHVGFIATNDVTHPNSTARTMCCISVINNSYFSHMCTTYAIWFLSIRFLLESKLLWHWNSILFETSANPFSNQHFLRLATHCFDILECRFPSFLPCRHPALLINCVVYLVHSDVVKAVCFSPGEAWMCCHQI